ncbi:MAG: 16S rRNA (adenine(1518)-N(6)/adenine(1519)-N(6))-dimethyltransferase RsmA [Gammaproteobacteria bacterium]|nr:16S rRNA (adenine(1518)-N(6)/adenine(1519)-N(6))-dimethyltransferase RsmA [Gammaproteobacteria bacterium]MCP4089573.1 16S rRNA (adenine(1518)-N(6)/adenine(1519)-N(6))-dimethyltransferase RsmA [Gammaproteobacteria bacterium]MCP4278092.1 16S rRNA (adenine(1518)-N(6)/adenine(1519)-N(6))-dimethyltransferase RsmA [Gammaproteobacteria bacterium]MCP4832464.1 16S rRNA (adenine(1518)-N(6)/adenine(1519)-N(6))-dimethyltransferase RsmA [Gammaproteobacteria bacterium]MCP4930156.1 16S rRNA (adenine(1518)-
MKTHSPRKRFGQNFLHDAGIIKRIINSLKPKDSDHYIEIGPGHGAITQPLASQVKQLDVIEIDHDLATELQAQAWFGDIRLHRADALKFDFNSIAQPPEMLRLVGNLPYNISTPLLFHILSQHHLFTDMHVMLQKEVVQRMTATPGNKIYGRLTVALAARCKVESLFIIKPGAFNPAPKIDSAFARLTPLEQPLIKPSEQNKFDTLLRHAFSQRRKQLGNALQELLCIEQIKAAGINPQHRAETLSVYEFIELTHQLEDSSIS